MLGLGLVVPLVEPEPPQPLLLLPVELPQPLLPAELRQPLLPGLPSWPSWRSRCYCC